MYILINHKIIGDLYFIFSFIMFIFSGLLILGSRFELIKPGLNIFHPEYFNSLITLHGLIMIFSVINTFFNSISYWTIPYLTFSKEMIFINFNFFNFFLYLISTFLIIFLWFIPSGNISVGWTLYTPLSIQMSYNINLFLYSVLLISFSTILNSINISITIIKNYNLNIKKMNIFLWSILITSYLVIIITPIFIGVLIMVFLDKNFNTSFFNPIKKGDPVLYQHLFWFFAHPEVYIMILPAFGIISNIIPIFSKKKLFSYKLMIYAIILIFLFSLLVWGHHMFVSGISIIGQFFFMYCTILISIPTGIKIFNWLFTIWRGFLILNTPMLFSIGFIIYFLIGGLSGYILSITPLNFYYHGTYFVVAHFHYILVSSTLFSIFSSWYYWSPLLINIKYNEKKSKYHFWLSLIFFNLTFFPMHFLGIKGMPRRYIDYPLNYFIYNKIITFFSLFLGFSQLYFFYFIFTPLLKLKYKNVYLYL